MKKFFLAKEDFINSRLDRWFRRNVFDNIAFPMILDGCDKSIVKKSVNDLLKKFGI